jgi:uncharacterized protein (DUF305 family)
MTLKQTEVSGIYREDTSGALISQDANALHAYKKRKNAQREIESFMQTIKQNQEKIIQLEMNYKSINRCATELFDSQRKEIEQMKSDLIEIKQLLSKITNNK